MIVFEKITLFVNGDPKGGGLTFTNKDIIKAKMMGRGTHVVFSQKMI